MVHLISGGYANSYLIEGENTLAAVDVGTILAAELIEKYIKKTIKGSEKSLSVIAATHFHIDHVGGIVDLKRRFPAAKVLFSQTSQDYLEGGKPLSVPPLHRWVFRLIPLVATMKHHRRNVLQGIKSSKFGIPLPLLRRIHNVGYDFQCTLSESIKIPGLSEWRIFMTPGHTPDSVCFYNEKDGALLSGDTVLNMKGKGEVNSFCCSIDEIRSSFERLAVLPVKHLCPGHGNELHGSNIMAEVKRI